MKVRYLYVVLLCCTSVVQILLTILLPWVILTVFHDLVHHFDTVTVGAVSDEVKGALTEAVHGIDITSPFHQVLGDLKPTLL